ncbi:MAG: extensin family protein [Pseudomonadota bacterium]
MKLTSCAVAIIPFFLMGCGLFGGGDRETRDLVTRGAVCGNPIIIGTVIDPVVSDTPGCGIAQPVRVTSVGGVSLSRGAVMECSTAQVLSDWVETDVDQIVGRMGGGVTEIQVAAHYVCRTRNHKRGARISEHGKGRAIDISAFTLADGSEISVSDHWGKGRRGRMLRNMRDSACGPFKTVLGPGSDGYHEDHFHFDVAQRDNDYVYCR